MPQHPNSAEASSTDPKAFQINPRAESVTDVVFLSVVNTHVSFTFISDHKAYVMIYVNSMIIGALTTILLPRLSENPELTIPAMLMLVTCFVSLSYSVLAIRPQIGTGLTSRDMVRNREANLLYFGNFHKMSLEDFQWSVQQVFKDDEHLALNMVRDLYFLGKALGVKYKQVRTSYNIFLFGMLLTVVIFVVSIFNESPP